MISIPKTNNVAESPGHPNPSCKFKNKLEGRNLEQAIRKKVQENVLLYLTAVEERQIRNGTGA
jgi:hypothetical protein